LVYIIALTLRGSHRGGSPRPQGFSQGWKPSPSEVLTGVEALALRGSHRGWNPSPSGVLTGMETIKIN